MCQQNLILATITAAILQSASGSWAVTVQSSGETGGPDAAQLAATIADASSNYFVVAGSENTTINAAGNPNSNPRAMGSFTNGMTAAGTPLPAINGGPAATYAGGIDINAGTCLCTGLVTDNDSQVTGVPAGLGVGVEGPNAGYDLSALLPSGEISFDLGTPNDSDFSNEVSTGSNATVLQFKIALSSPGILRISFVHATDEHPVYTLATYNDTPLVFVGDANGQNLENIILFKSNGVESTLTLEKLRECGPPIFKENLVAPDPPSLPDKPNGHAEVETDLHFDHEFAGFTKKLTRETKCVLAPGTYTIKIVVQDVFDAIIDSATFFEQNSLKLYSFLAADFDLDGDVDGNDFLIWQQNRGNQNAKFTDGDANGDGKVTGADLQIWDAPYGQAGGHKNFCADFDRDGFVGGSDFLIWQINVGLAQCASRYEGDADGDGDVDGNDLAIWDQESNTNSPSGLCGCGASQQAMAGGGATASGALAAEDDATAVSGHPADSDGDGDFDLDDRNYWMNFYGLE